jgi:hypothetical protein
MSTRRLNVANLEFDQIKQNLKEFLRGQDQFSDFDFEGSNMSILLDVLAYNTHYNALYTNMALNETYLDSASRRDSVVSIATALGYVPRSHICAKTTLNFTVAGIIDPPSFLTLPKNTTFTGIKDSIRYTFYTREDITVARNEENEFNFIGVEILEGAPVVTTIEYTEKNSFTIPNDNIDTTTLLVKVQTTPSSTVYENFALATELTSITDTTPVYFLREAQGGLYQISFGDNVFGKKLEPGNVINLTYFVCSGEEPNGIRSISYAGDGLLGGSIENIQIQTPVASGRFKETLEEVRFNAPNFYASQNRAVSAIDYETIILKKVPEIEAVNVWGGENNMPPVYGKVFISAKTTNGRELTLQQQQNIINNVLNEFKVVSVIPEFVKPEYLEVELDVVAYYDKATSTKTASELQSIVTDVLLEYNDVELEKFNRIIRQSMISRIVGSSDPAFISTVPRMKIYRTVTPLFNRSTNYTISIGNPFTRNSIRSSKFFLKDYPHVCYIDDNCEFGELRLVALIDGVITPLRRAGSIDYNGTIVVTDLNIVRLVDGTFTFAFTPSSADVAGLFNQIVRIDESKLKVTLIADETAKGRVISGNKFTFTPSRI